MGAISIIVRSMGVLEFCSHFIVLLLILDVKFVLTELRWFCFFVFSLGL